MLRSLLAMLRKNTLEGGGGGEGYGLKRYHNVAKQIGQDV